jgi:hypothetical protein
MIHIAEYGVNPSWRKKPREIGLQQKQHEDGQS